MHRRQAKENQERSTIDTVDLITYLVGTLSVSERQEVEDRLLGERNRNDTPRPREQQRAVVALASTLDDEGTPITVGDTVVVLKDGKTGKVGDLATVIKIEAARISVELVHNKSRTNRSSKFLKVVKDE